MTRSSKNEAKNEAKRQVLVISGRDNFDPLFNEPAINAPRLLEKLAKRADIDLTYVGDEIKHLTVTDVKQAIDQLDKNRPTTIILQCHGTMKSGSFQFILGDKTKMTSADFFTYLKSHFVDAPVDIFSPACYGGGMMQDRALLPHGSVVVSLTDHKTENNGSDFDDMVSNLDKLDLDLSAYNLLKFYLLNFLHNRFTPLITRSEGGPIDLNNLLTRYCSAQNRPRIKRDSGLEKLMLNLDDYKSILRKMFSAKNEYAIYAAEYGKALAILLNETAKEYNLFEYSQYDPATTDAGNAPLQQ